jgi:hypothetical protein
MRAEKVKKNAREFLPWAGYFCNQKEEPEAFASLPGWRQREARYTRERVGAGLPVTLEDYLRFQHGGASEDVTVSLPRMLTLDALRRHAGNRSPKDTLPSLRQAFDYDWMVREITALGEGRQLVRSKPLHGFLAYVWLLALVHKKIIPTLPLNAFWDLEEGVHQLTGERFAATAEGAAPVLEWVESQTSMLLSTVA